MVENTLTLVPAYGRYYETPDEMREDWESGKDFCLWPSGPYCSIRDIDLMKRKGYKALIIKNNPKHEKQFEIDRIL